MSDGFRSQIPNLLPDAATVQQERPDGTFRIRLICARCAAAAKPTLRLYATLAGLGDHVTSHHHATPAFYKNHTPDELQKEIENDDE